MTGRVDKPPGRAESFGVNGGGPELRDLLNMGLVLATCVLVGFGLGWLLDLWFASFPGLALAGLLVGAVAASVYFYKTYKKYSG